MDKIKKAICDVCKPLYEGWKQKAGLTKDEAIAYWQAEFEGRTILSIADGLGYSSRTINRLILSVQKKINKIL